MKKNISSEEREAAELKQVSCVQLLFQLIPPVHLALLKDLLLFLQVCCQCFVLSAGLAETGAKYTKQCLRHTEAYGEAHSLH